MLWVPNLYALDILRTVTPTSGGGKSIAYKNEVLRRALEVTQNSYGDFNMINSRVDMKPDRAIKSIQKGNLINVAIIAANKEWDQNTLAIKIPIRGGTLSYRLLLINKTDLDKFSQLNNLESLQSLTVGLQNDWSTTKIFQRSQLPTIKAHNFEGLFLMLNKQRIDYIPRAIYEIYDELSNRKKHLENVIIAPNIALYIPMVSYLYVSPSTPKLAKRLELGLTQLSTSGELEALFKKYYAKDLAFAQLENRTLIHLNNPYFNDESSLDQEKLWQLH